MRLWLIDVFFCLFLFVFGCSLLVILCVCLDVFAVARFMLCVRILFGWFDLSLVLDVSDGRVGGGCAMYLITPCHSKFNMEVVHPVLISFPFQFISAVQHPLDG